MSKIGGDINYPKELLDLVFKCRFCGSSLLMFGCESKDCKNGQERNLKEKALLDSPQ